MSSNIRIPEINQITIAGRITRDLELCYTKSGKAYCRFGVAASKHYVSNGEKKEDTTFVDVVVWDKQAEMLAQHSAKGKPVLVEGSLKFEQWEDLNGNKRTKLEINAQRVHQLEWGGDAQAAPKDERRAKQAPAPEPQQTDLDDDVPF